MDIITLCYDFIRARPARKSRDPQTSNTEVCPTNVLSSVVIIVVIVVVQLFWGQFSTSLTIVAVETPAALESFQHADLYLVAADPPTILGSIHSLSFCRRTSTRSGVI